MTQILDTQVDPQTVDILSDVGQIGTYENPIRNWSENILFKINQSMKLILFNLLFPYKITTL